MDISSGLKSEVFRPTVYFLIPGIMATAPYVAVAFHFAPELHKLAADHVTIASVLLLLIAIAAGLIVEELGTRIEVTVIDPKLLKSNAKHDETWYAYLRCAFDKPPIGQGHIRDLVTHLKFELNFAVALALAWCGAFWLYCLDVLSSGRALLALAAIALVVGGYLLFEAYKTAEKLAELRRRLLLGTGQPPGLGAK